MEDRNKGRGGCRKGAGRPKGDSKLYSFRCPSDIARRLDGRTNRTEFINESLRRALAGSESSAWHNGTVTRAESVKPLHLPYFDLQVRAGFPVPLDNDERSQDIELLTMLCPHPEASYLIRVKGDSMIDAGVQDGDIVIVDKSRRNPSPREIAVCELNGEYTIKRFQEENGQGWLIPANPDYPRLRVTDNDEFRIWGTVTYIIHKARD
ncbi:MAG: translesion error-prone DNA polymerase V autoproteolytic subunit [Bacteroidales bacterium]|nr:translesion error-prone DNA polymerase V autoproteolytic subunit [Bacteroidales bacterium]